MTSVLTYWRRSGRGLAWIAIAVAVLLLLSSAALAQVEKGIIAGTVTDTSGAVVVGAAVTVTGAGTNAVRTATTDGAGSYTVTNIAPGAYQLKVVQTGFGDYPSRQPV